MNILNKFPSTFSNGIFLRKLQVDDIISKYNKGYYHNLDLLQLRKEIKKEYILPDFQSVKVIKRKDAGIYTIKDKDSTSYKLYIPPEDNYCQFCRRELNSNTLGIPVDLKVTEDEVYIFYMENTYFCSFECCYSYIRIFKEYSNSESILKFLYYLTTKSHDLKYFPDWRIASKRDMQVTKMRKIGNVKIEMYSPVYSIEQ
jgi:hypothetical protein